jgi:hypothetical protein
MLDQTHNVAEIMFSILDRMDGFMYRCRNDAAYTMLFMQGDVQKVTGFPATAFTGHEQRSYSALTHPDDLKLVYASVDAALAKRSNWHVYYRLVRPNMTELWVYETGGGVWQGNELQYLEGVIVDSDTTRRTMLRSRDLLERISSNSRELVSHSEPITEVLQILRILALNARLEAARAGTHGAAFGFVAHEMSLLADKSAGLADAIAAASVKLAALLQIDSEVTQ